MEDGVVCDVIDVVEIDKSCRCKCVFLLVVNIVGLVGENGWDFVVGGCIDEEVVEVFGIDVIDLVLC